VRPPVPADEAARLAALRAQAVLDTPPEQAFDDLARLAALLCGTPVALVSLVDGTRQWFKARVGTDLEQTPRDVAFCAHALVAPEEVFVVEDTLADARFSANPLVTGPLGLRFYAGAPLLTAGGHALGTLCVVDVVPRSLPAAHAAALKALARQVVGALELRRLQRGVPLPAGDDLAARLRVLWPAATAAGESIGLALCVVDGAETTDAAALLAEHAVPGRSARDLVVPLPGGGLALLLPAADASCVHAAAEWLRARVAAALVAPGARASAGVAALVPTADADPAELLACARSALAGARAAGGGCTQVFVGRAA
jgi:GAF domain-containing protein